MSLSRQPEAYRDCYEILAAAISLPGGCRTFCGPEFSTAEYLRARIHQARSLLRDQSRRAYPPTHPAYGSSEYDQFKITIKLDDDGDHWLYVEPHGNWDAVSKIEPIPEAERVIPVEALRHRIEAVPQLMPPAPATTDDELE